MAKDALKRLVKFGKFSNIFARNPGQLFNNFLIKDLTLTDFLLISIILINNMLNFSITELFSNFSHYFHR